MSKFTQDVEQSVETFKTEHPTAFPRFVIGTVCFLIGFIVGHFAA